MENEISIYIARFAALIYIPLAISFLTGQVTGKQMMESYKNAGLRLFIGIFAVGMGLFLTMNHNIWVKQWPVLITILGWIALIEGVAYIAFPKTLARLAERMGKNDKMWSWIALVIGVIFAYFGFFN